MTAGVLAGLGIGIALAGTPGPVQAVILAEAARGGPSRGLQAVAGASLTFGTLLVALALGLSALAVEGLILEGLQIVGGAFLIWLAVDGLRAGSSASASSERRSLPPAARGSLAVLLNPGAWLFLGAVASPLFSWSAAAGGGTTAALLAAVALMAGAAAGDAVLTVIGGIGLRRASARVGEVVQRGLAVVLGLLGAWLLLSGMLGLAR